MGRKVAPPSTDASQKLRCVPVPAGPLEYTWPAASTPTVGSPKGWIGSITVGTPNVIGSVTGVGGGGGGGFVVVVTINLPVYGCGVELANPQASALYVAAARLLCASASVVVLPSLDAISPLGPTSVSTSSLVFPLPLAGVHVMLNAKIAVAVLYKPEGTDTTNAVLSRVRSPGIAPQLLVGWVPGGMLPLHVSVNEFPAVG